MKNRSSHKEDIVILDIYTHNKRTSNHMKQNWQAHTEIDANITVVGDFNTLPSIIGRTSIKNIHKNIENLNIINQIGTTNIYRTWCLTEHRFLSHAHIIFYQRRPYTVL